MLGFALGTPLLQTNSRPSVALEGPKTVNEIYLTRLHRTVTRRFKFAITIIVNVPDRQARPRSTDKRNKSYWSNICL
jgi:hypothetical protein